MSAFEAEEHDAVVRVGGEVVPVEQGRRQAIPLNCLFLSQKNARKVRNPESIPALAAMIDSQGILYPLCVVAEQQVALANGEARKKIKGRKAKKGDGAETAEAADTAQAHAADTFGVVAGGRRLAALKWLVAEGRMAADSPIECLVFDVGRATAVSLVENVAQEPMNQADVLVAMKALVEEGQSAGQIAAAFGVSVLTVERRLKLASLAPQFVDLYREGKIAMDVLQALALSDDPAQQVNVWESLETYNRSAYQIRQLLTRNEISTESPLAVFVGIEAYRQAGGSVREDLFSTEGTSLLQDSALLNRLALDKLEGEAEKMREAGWKWAEARISFPYAERSRFAQLRCEKVKATKQERDAMQALEADQGRIRTRIDELESLVYGDDAEEDREWTSEEQAEHDSLEDQWQVLDDHLDAMGEALREWTPQQKAIAGVILSIDSDGQVHVAEGLVTADDRKALVQAGEQGQAKDGFDDDPAGRDSGTRSGATSLESAPKERAEFSASLCQNLTAHRTAAVAAAFTQNPQAALAALLHTLIVHEREPWQSSPLNVRFESNAHGIGSAAAEYDETPAAQLIAQAEVIYDKLPGDSARLFDHLQAMDLSGLLDVLALFVGRAYSVQCGDPVREIRRGFDPAQGIERVLGVDMADWWNPTPERYLRHVPKAKMIAAVTEGCGAQAAQPLEKMKKDEAVKAAAQLEGKRWLPSTLRPYATGSAGVDEEGEDDESTGDIGAETPEDAQEQGDLGGEGDDGSDDLN
ncbi:hypothetical protein WKW77_34105 [Variovorax ureilyticus]|uniref:Chromosome partitioning protein ParB n=1 Tax=Variovorax ureilyticus TaxID=1836198 RepID=A0ABU8VR28_9BURK